MTDRSAGGEQRKTWYDVQLTGRPPDSMRSDYPDMTVRTMRGQTALRRAIVDPHELDALLHEVGTMGLTLTAVHRLPNDQSGAFEADGARTGAEVDRDASTATYEVRVAGELGRPLLRHLGCSHYAVPPLTLVRLALADRDLNRFLRACTDCGATVQQVRRVDSSR